jgi:hypothetical protein
MFKLISLGFLIWAFFNPSYASIAFIGFFILIEGYFLFLDIITKNQNLNFRQEKYNLTDDELKIFKKYYVYYSFPGVSTMISQIISGFGLSVIIWIPLLLYNKLWIPTIVIGLNFILTLYLSRKLNPLHFANYAEIGQKMFFEKREIKSVYDKIHWRKDAFIKKILHANEYEKHENKTIKNESVFANHTVSEDINGNPYKTVSTYKDGRVSVHFDVFDSEKRVIFTVGDLGNGHKYSHGYSYDFMGNKQSGLHQTLSPDSDIYDIFKNNFSRTKHEESENDQGYYSGEHEETF